MSATRVATDEVIGIDAGLTSEQRTEHALADTAVDRVQALAGGNLDAADVLRTRDIVRPRFECGELVLHVRPAGGGVVVPSGSPDPTPCCADH